MTKQTDRETGVQRLYVLAMVNAGIWAIAMIALVFVIDDYPGAKGMYPILGGGTAVAIALIASIGRTR